MSLRGGRRPTRQSQLHHSLFLVRYSIFTISLGGSLKAEGFGDGNLQRHSERREESQKINQSSFILNHLFSPHPCLSRRSLGEGGRWGVFCPFYPPLCWGAIF